ncbi:macro domain-containing protein [Streptomyces johnsoniae]|uniref:Macro domain-containing protein n=1 Tax=Streptomyces johnsoniae TaxID=3075532 RepID=A0ABU2SBE9_9ACTN|nr:hypothetical protein [Streptomyces sp. DSM 41886]MDT0445430.1 hypothetical protein [Streptomyces sp. DSM 41886]
MSAALPDYESILGEVRAIRRFGLPRLRQLAVPSLAAAAGHRDVERLLRACVARLDPGTLREAAEYSLGLAMGTRDWPAADRRRRAAELYGVSVERFRKHQEVLILGQVAEEAVRIAGEPEAVSLGDAAPVRAVPHRTLRVAVGRRALPVVVHAHPVDLLRDVDVVVAPANVFFALPEPYKSSISASLRRAGAARDVGGGMVEDRIHDELQGWLTRHRLQGRPALPGTVVPTGSGALAAQGVRRIYHAAVAVPRAGTNDYDVLPADVTRAVSRSFAVLRGESGEFDPPLRSICLPLLGSGRGGLSYEVSFTAVWAAVEAEIARGADWDVHWVVRDPSRGDLIERLLAA